MGAHVDAPVVGPLVGALEKMVPWALLYAVIFYPHLDRLLAPLLAEEEGRPNALARAVWSVIGHVRYELPCILADTVGQVLVFFPRGFYAEVEPYTREGRRARNDAAILKLQRIKSEADKLRAEEAHPEVLRRLIDQLETARRCQRERAIVDHCLASEDGRKALRRYKYLSSTALAALRERLAEAEVYWEDKGEGVKPKRGKTGRSRSVKARKPTLSRPSAKRKAQRRG